MAIFNFLLLSVIKVLDHVAEQWIAENASGSDSDTNPDETPDYYQPISALDEEDFNANNGHDFHGLSNGNAHMVETDTAFADRSDRVERENEEAEGEDEEEEEERMRKASESATQRAFREDDSRRNAPLTPENAMRVMDAMRGVSFGSLAPDWASQIPENQWIARLQRMRRSLDSTSKTQN